MCGIAGTLRFDGRPVLGESLAAMCELLRHRGPDDAGWLARGNVGLANTRLKIIDLSPNGRQPILNEDGSVAVVLNGEIYNFPELRRDLESRGHAFRSSTDTEVIVHLYEEMGTDFIARLDGMFALALWDDRQQRLILARDRVGKKPLFYYADSRVLVFGSEIKALFACPDVPREMEPSNLSPFLAFGYVPCPRTLYRGILQLDPGCCLIFHACGHTEKLRYWNHPQVQRKIVRAAARDELRFRMDRAVQKRLISDVPLGAFLSGGVDSSIVVGLMAALQQEPVRTFSIGFENAPDFDERHYARLVANRFGTKHQEFVVGPQSVGLIEKLVWHHDQPFMDSSAIPTYLLSKLAREHVTVVLNGDGGDELFAGYRRFQVAMAAERVPGRMLRLLRWCSPLLRLRWAGLSAAAERISSSGKLKSNYRLWGVLPLWSSELWRALRPEYLPSSDEELFAFMGEGPRQTKNFSPLSRLLWLNFHDYLPNDLLVKMDRCTMAHGLEARSPFLDTSLVEFAATLPDGLKLRLGRTKVLLRETFRDLLPVKIQRRGKQGFGVPLASWFRAELGEFVDDQLGSPRARIYDFIDYGFIRNLIRDFRGGNPVSSDAIWCLLTLETWLQQHLHSGSHQTAPGAFAHATQD